MYFDCIKHSGKPCALPSKAADSVWLAWERLAPAGLEAFCIKHFGRAIAHTEAASMMAQLEDALETCLAQARRLEARGRAAPALPRLFALDRVLKMPGGFGYKRAACGQVAFSPLNRRGLPGADVFYPSALAPMELMMAGLITTCAYDAYVARAKSGAL
jgi:hypothetical protein